jgi:hypothetical protein
MNRSTTDPAGSDACRVQRGPHDSALEVPRKGVRFEDDLSCQGDANVFTHSYRCRRFGLLTVGSYAHDVAQLARP